jgi:hypothetical protein
LQAEFHKVTGQDLTLSLKRRAVLLSALIPSVSIVIEVCYQLLDITFHVVQLLTDTYLFCLRLLTAALWHIFCTALETAADKALQSFQLVSNGSLREMQKINESFRLLP